MGDGDCAQAVRFKKLKNEFLKSQKKDWIGGTENFAQQIIYSGIVSFIFILPKCFRTIVGRACSRRVERRDG